MRKKKISLKSIVATTIVSATLLNSVAAFAVGLNNFENGFAIENGIGQNLNNVSGVVNGELKYVYTERDKLIKDEGGVRTLNIKEVGSEEEDDNVEPFSQSADGTTRNKLRYMYGGYKKEPSDPDEFKGFTPFLNTASNPNEPTTIKELMEFLNSHKNPLGSCTTVPHSINNTCMFALKNFYNFYCLLLQKSVIGWHSYINRIVDGATRDISQYFNPIKSWSDYTVYVNSTVATGFDDYFEGSRDNEAALGGHTDTFSREYDNVPNAPTPGTYSFGALNKNDLEAEGIYLGKSSSRSELFFTGDPREEISNPLKNMIQNENSNLGTTTEIQSASKISLMVNSNDTLKNNNALDSGELNKYQLPGIDDNIGFRPDPGWTPTTITMNKYNVRPNNERTLTRYSNATYFLYPFAKNEDGYANPINLYDFDNDGNTCNRETNTYSYGLAFSKKHTRAVGKGLWERGQATVWAGTGTPKFDHIGVSASTVADIEGDETADSPYIDMELDENHDTVTAEGYDPNNIVLYIAGRALDLYENELAKDYGSPSQAAHDKAVEGSTPGTDDNLKNKVIVSTKGLGTIAPDGSTNDDFDSSMIGTTADATGTVLVGEGADQSYLIGPFLMSDYTYAGSEYVVPFSGQDVEKYKPLIGGIVGGELTLTSDMGGEQKVLIGKDTNTEAQIVYETPKGEDYSSDKTAWNAGMPSLTDAGAGSTSGSSGSNTFLQDVDELLDGYEYPRPKSVFYIKIKKSTCGDSDTLKNIRFVYRQTYSDGDGWVIAARYIESKWKAGAIEDGCSDFSCDNVPTDGVAVDNKHPDCQSDGGKNHAFPSCNGTKGDYEHTDNCELVNCKYPHGCDHDPCSGCATAADGSSYCAHSCSECDTYDCTQRVYCTHGYRDCLHTSAYTLIDGAKIHKAQPTLALHQTKVDLRDYCYDAEVWVRLTTFVSINKYIYDVEHSPEDGNDAFTTADYNSTYPEALLETEDPDLSAEISGDYQKVTREKLSENKKNGNPVYVEYGDTVIYHIQLLNYQKKDISLKVKDILPKNSIFLSIENITENMEDVDLSDSTFTTEKDIGSGDEVKLLTDKSVDKNVKLDSDEPDERTIVTDWIVVPGTDSPATPPINGEPNIVTLSVKIMVEEWSNELLYENKAVIVTRNAGPDGEDDWSDDHTIEDYMRVIDNGVEEDPDPSTYGDEFPFAGPDSVPGPVVNLTELETEDRDADMPTPRIVSSDWYILNNYNAFMDKFVYKYDEAMQHENNVDNPDKYNYLKDGYISTPDAGSKDLYYDDMGEDDILVKPRINDNTTDPKTYTLDDSTTSIMLKKYDESEEFDALENKHIDPNIKDTVRNPGDKKETRYNEVSKKIHPVSVEKSEVVTYAVKVSNEAKIVGKTSEASKTASGVIAAEPHLSGSKPATQVRPTKITDYLEEGLELVSVEARIYDEKSDTDSPNRKTPDLIDRYDSVDIGSPSASDGATLDIEPDREYKKIEVNLGDDEIILNPGECIVYFVTVKVRESNMYLNDLQNYAEINILTNINKKTEDGITFDDEYRVVRDETDENYNMNIALQETSSDWLRLKDLVIAGRVWVDFNRNGYMDEEKLEGTEFEKYSKYYNVDEYGRKKEVEVKLYRKDDQTKPIRTTLTDETGMYTFGRKEDGSTYYDEYNYEEVSGHSKEFSSNDTYQRVDKAESKDEYGNYKDDAKYIDYYVEFEYDGVVYRSTESYSGSDNVHTEDDDTFGMYDNESGNKTQYADDVDDSSDHDGDERYTKLHDDDGTKGENYSFKYEVDSNAAEFKNVRTEYNKKFEYISYNVAYEASGASASATKTNTQHELVFDKKNHISELMEDKDGSLGRYIQARSFIDNATLAGNHGKNKIPDDYWTNEAVNWDTNDISVDKDDKNTQFLWLCKKDEQKYEKVPETEYLKHINLGLEFREDVDLALTKDVYKVKTTINGEEMEYTYNQNNGLNGDMPADHEYLNDYIIKKPYGLELYESDYKYRYDQYKAKEVRDYKGEESELNIEVTYRVTVKNKSVSDDDELKEKIGDRKPPVKDTKFEVKLHEVLDLYDQNFITYKDNPDETINIKTKDKNGFLVNTPIKIAEAWFYQEGTEGGEDGKTYFVENEGSDAKPVYKEIITEGAKKTTVPDGAKIYIRKNLKLSNSSQNYSNPTRPDGPEKTKDPMTNGYKRLYIYGMDEGDNIKYFTIPEGEERDLYVKYVLDKDALEIESHAESWSDTQEVTTRTVDGEFEQVHVTTESTTTTQLQRAIKIAEKAMEKLTPRGTENIAQVNGYSVWYAHNHLPASIVDMDSNVGNVGKKNTQPADDYSVVPHNVEETSVDDIDYYEDTVYKTGIEIIAERTENTEDTMKSEKGVIKFRRPGITKITRELTGLVWDDSRTDKLEVEESVEEKKALQYLGDGIYDKSKSKVEEAKANGNVEEFYKNPGDLNEDKDIEVRNARAELVEIVQVPVGDEYHFYEEILANVTWEQTQHTRTGSDGKYKLDGFIPGKYIVRFAYGDTVPEGEGDANAVTDMQIFNGQDYKTTQYSYEMDDYSKDRASKGEIEISDEEYKALTTTNGTIDVYAASLEDKNGLSNVDTVLAALERPNLSDARDDEVRRLEVNNYSEVMVNLKAEILKGLANGPLTTTTIKGHEDDIRVNYYSNGSDKSTNTADQLKELTDNTNMYAETAEFLVKAEKLTFDQTTNGDYVYFQYTGKPDDLKIYYNKLDNMEYKTVDEREFKIQNIDMGIEYRPETGISLTKEINNVQLVTSDNEVLMDLKLYTTVDENGLLEHHIDTENSIGAELVQFVTNGYSEKELIQELIHMNEEDLQGFAYIAVDEDILQGCKIIVQYKFSAQNDCEIDKVSKAIDAIRFYGNQRTQDIKNNIYKVAIDKLKGDGEKFYLNLIPVSSMSPEEKSGDEVIKTVARTAVKTTGTESSTGTEDKSGESSKETQYTANNLARNIVRYDVYDSLPGFTSEDVYRDRAKTMIKDEVNTIDDPDGSDGYFGKYVAYTYYIGNDHSEKLDNVSSLKFDKIIDYVDSDLEFGQLSQTDITKLNNNLGSVTTNTNRMDTKASGVDNSLLNVLDSNYNANQAWSNNSLQPIRNLYEYLYKLNKTPVESSGGGDSEEKPKPTPTNPLSILQNLDGIEYRSLLVSTPDRTYDDREDENSRNQLFSRFLTPSIVNKDESIATVYLPVSKVLATETDMENMQYENIAEVIQFTVLTGRRTNFDTTIGNADIHEVDKQLGKTKYEPIGSIEFVTAALEPDTASTETITLTPPTGLMRNRRVIREAVDTTTNVIEIAVIAIAVVVTILIITKITIVKIKKKRYK